MTFPDPITPLGEALGSGWRVLLVRVHPAESHLEIKLSGTIPEAVVVVLALGILTGCLFGWLG